MGELKRTVKVRKTVPRQEGAGMDSKLIAQAVRTELEKAGVYEIMAWREEVNTNLAVIGTILSDLQSTATLAGAGSSEATKVRFEELAFNLGQALSNVGHLVGPAQQDEDEVDEPRTMSFRPNALLDEDEGDIAWVDDGIAEAIDEDEADDPASRPRTRRRR